MRTLKNDKVKRLTNVRETFDEKSFVWTFDTNFTVISLGRFQGPLVATRS